MLDMGSYVCIFGYLNVITQDVFVYRKPAVIMIVGVNGGGKTTSLGMFDEYNVFISISNWVDSC